MSDDNGSPQTESSSLWDIWWEKIRAGYPEIIAATIGGVFVIMAAFIGLIGAILSNQSVSQLPIETATSVVQVTTEFPTDTSVPTEISTANTPSKTPVPFTPTSVLPEAELVAMDGVKSNSEWEPHAPYVQEFEGVEMVLVPTGCFIMGITDEQVEYLMETQSYLRGWFRNEQPAEQQCVEKPFWIDRYEVSQSQFVSLEGSASRVNCLTGNDLPRDCINWLEASAYCEKRDGRLPTEKEWEYAARGPDSLIYPWGNILDVSKANSDSGDNYTGSVNVSFFASGASWVGALQMSGNVWEWTSSPYVPYPYDSQNEESEEALSNNLRVIRGGSWLNSGRFLSTTNRQDYFYLNRTNETGFRCARDYTGS